MPGTAPTGDSVIHRLYTAFAAGDGRAMEACYAPDATFEDPVFELSGADRIGGMWRMLLEGGDDLVVDVSEVEAREGGGDARWEARYTFTPTGRAVHNVVRSSFVLEGDRIAVHTDEFGFWRWSRQALGAPGVLLGWTPALRRRVRHQAQRGLDRYLTGTGDPPDGDA